jgi:RNA polymerase sigma factor (sigma-70 family)
MIDDDKAFQHSKRAHACANRLHRNREGAEDYAQDALLQTIEHPEWQVDFRYRVLDAIRKDHGRTGTLKHAVRRNLENSKHLDPESVYGPSFENLREPRQTDPLEFARFREMLSGLKPSERAIIILRYFWSFTEIEIADCFGVTESRICQKLSDIHEKIKTGPKPKKEKIQKKTGGKKVSRFSIYSAQLGEVEHYKPAPKPTFEKWEKGFNEQVRDFEAELLLKALKEANYVKAHAAEICGLLRTTFLEKLNKLGL